MIRKLVARYFVSAVLLVGATGFVYAGPFDSCREYVKLGVPGNDGDPLCRKGYALAHNPETKTPFWVAEHLTREKASAVRARSNDFQPDPDLEEGDRAELADYSKSGFDRGHMAPAGDMRWDEQAMSESFYLSTLNYETPNIPTFQYRKLYNRTGAARRLNYENLDRNLLPYASKGFFLLQTT